MSNKENAVQNNVPMDNGDLRWAVVGYNRGIFSEEFISTHPMDFYENEDQIKGEYDIYLMNKHGYYTPSVEYRNGPHTGFKSSQNFYGSDPTEEGDFRLRHLRMLIGTEDISYFSFDLADVASLLRNKDISVEGSSFSISDSVATIVKWFRDIDKRHSIKDSNAIIVYEGNEIDKLVELVEEVSEWFDVEVVPVAYSDEAETNRINISFWWYEATDEVRSLREHWDQYYNDRSNYLSGEKIIDMDDYCELVRRTWRYICHIAYDIENSLEHGSSRVEIGRSFLLGFYEYLKVIERITYYSMLPEKDNSKDYTFTISALIADELSRLAAGKKLGTPQYNIYGEFYGFSGCSMDVTLAATSPGSSERVLYDIEKKNYQVLFDAAKRINEER